MENECTYVSSRGLLKSTDIHNIAFQSSSSVLEADVYSKIERGSVVYVCNSALVPFFNDIFPRIIEPFVLVSGDSDVSVPNDSFSEDRMKEVLADSRLHHWFCQNLTLRHPKLTAMPIGLDYHTISKEGYIHPWGSGCSPREQEAVLEKYVAAAPPLTNRYIHMYSNWHHSLFGLIDRGDRREAYEKIPRECIMYYPTFTPRDAAWDHQSHFAFVASPSGGGLDCHRTWEALILGCIPVVKHSGLDQLYEDLPVLLIDDWSQLTQAFLLDNYNRIKDRSWNLAKLKLKYWVEKFREASQQCHEVLPPSSQVLG